MSVSTALFAVLVVGVITYFMRAGLILALADAELPDELIRALRYVAPAVLAALVVSLVSNPELPNRGVSLAEVVGVVVAIPVAWKTKNLIATLGVGMSAFWVVLALS